MDHQGLAHALEEMGLPKNAAAIYISLLGAHKMTISEIARESKIKRATCYEYLDFLLNKDFVIRIPVGKRMFYAAVDPKKILTDFKKKTALLEHKIDEMIEIREHVVQRPRVVFYEGKREIKNIYEDMFKTIGDVYSIFPPATFFENFTEQDYEDFERSIGQYALTSRDLFVSDKHYKRLQEIRAKSGPSKKISKRLPNWFTCNVDVLIYSQKVALISLRDLSAIVIENKDIADLFRNMHSFMWKSV